MHTTALKIRKRRNELDYSQEYMAQQLEISQPAYAKLESGDTKINIKRLERIAEILTVDITDLLDGNTVVNNFHNNGEGSKGFGFVENLYQDNKEYTDRIIAQLEADKSRLLAENERLLNLLEEQNKG